MTRKKNKQRYGSAIRLSQIKKSIPLLIGVSSVSIGGLPRVFPSFIYDISTIVRFVAIGEDLRLRGTWGQGIVRDVSTPLDMTKEKDARRGRS